MERGGSHWLQIQIGKKVIDHFDELLARGEFSGPEKNGGKKSYENV